MVTAYVCMDCGKEIEMDLATTKKVQCPFCGYRIIRKERAQIVKKVISK